MRSVWQRLRCVLPENSLYWENSNAFLDMKTTLPVLPEPTEAEIQHQAYLLWLEGGCRPGRELDDWLAARELLRHQHGRAPAVKPPTAKKNRTTPRN